MGNCCKSNKSVIEPKVSNTNTDTEKQIEQFIHTLQNAKREHYNDFSFNNLKRFAKVVHIHDGDTVRVVFYMNEPPNKSEKPIMTSVRLFGIDTPEIRTKDLKEKEMGLKAKERLKEIIQKENLIRVSFGKNDKYGRPLATLYKVNDNFVFDNSINNQLVKEKLAVRYFGKTKVKFSESTYI